MVTCGLDKQMKVWDARTYKESLSYYSHRPGSNLAISQTGLVAVSFGGQVQVSRAHVHFSDHLCSDLITRCNRGTSKLVRVLIIHLEASKLRANSV